MKILTNSQGKVLISSDGVYKSNAITYLSDTKEALQSLIGTGQSIADEDVSTTIENMPFPTTLEVGATTIQYDASHTENIATNNHCRIKGDDGNYYTLAEWNAMFVEAGYDKDNMTVEPIGIYLEAFENSEVYLFDRYTGVIYNPVGDSAASAGLLQSFIYNHVALAAGSWTDTATGKQATVTASGNNYILYTANTKQSWTVAKGTNPLSRSHRMFNMEERTYSMWAQTEWMRHRMAIDSGITTTKSDGTLGEIQILNSSGSQAAVGEDMYFWIKNDSDTLVNTNILAKYNLNNRHTISSLALTQAIADAIYTRQIANGINMNDTGINSSTKPILAPGSKGAEVIAVDGKWMIITPYISSASATVATVTNNMADSPAVYWAIYKGYNLPTDSLLYAIYLNKTLCDVIITYLNNREGRNISVVPTSSYTWSGCRFSATGVWVVNLSVGYVNYSNSYNRYFVVGSSAT